MSTKNEAGNALGMSDEEFMKQDPLDFEDDPVDDTDHADDKDDEQEDTKDQDDSDQGDDQENNDDEESDQTGDSDDDSDGDDSDQDDDDAAGDSAKAGDAESGAGDSADDRSEKDDKSDKKVDVSGELTEPQLAAIGRQIMGEFKANGGVMKVKSAEDAITLMQMGANYHQKMRGLKPALKALKLLENHDLMDPAKLNFLIDLSQKKPAAITQLLKDSKLDPMELDLQGDQTYVPDNRNVSDSELLLDEVLDSISHSSRYQDTLKVIGSDWDNASRVALATEPQKIRVLNGHMENGVFDQVIQAVQYERSMGKLVGVSDFDAYQQIGQRMHEKGEFVNRATGQPDQQRQVERQDSQQSQPNNTADKQRQDRKKAASPNRQKPGGEKDSSKYDPLNMSDEEFAKVNNLNL